MNRILKKIILLSSISAAVVSVTAIYGIHLMSRSDSHYKKEIKHESEWISVCEKLPRLGQIVWVYVPCDSGERVSISRYDDNSDGSCYFKDLETGFGWEDDDVTHWKKVRFPEEPLF